MAVHNRCAILEMAQEVVHPGELCGGTCQDPGWVFTEAGRLVAIHRHEAGRSAAREPQLYTGTRQDDWRVDPYHVDTPQTPYVDTPQTPYVPAPQTLYIDTPQTPYVPAPSSIIVRVPNGDTTTEEVAVTVEDFQRQVMLHRRVVRHLGGADLSGSATDYIETFGRLHPTLAPYGDYIWAGLARICRLSYLQSRHGWYLHRAATATDDVHFGWFTVPTPFTRDNAREPPQTDLSVDGRRYPAIFIVTGSECTCWMSCLAILLLRARMWLVDMGRVVLIEERFQARFRDLIR